MLDNNTARTATPLTPEERSWTAPEYMHWSATGEFPAWHPSYNPTAPDHSVSRNHKHSKLKEAFLAFHQRHPEVYQWIVFFARGMKQAGYPKYGMKSIIERVRWHIDLNNPQWKDSEGTLKLKINNNHAPFYSRLVMEKEPDLRNFFDIREQSFTGCGNDGKQ